MSIIFCPRSVPLSLTVYNQDVHPDRSIAIVDDSQVISIQAEKVKGDVQWYEVMLEGE